MSDFLIMTFAFLAGLALGGVFFGGLWWTVQRAAKSAYVALWFGLSFILRIGLVVSGFYVVSGGHWLRLLLCLAGFTLARIVIIRLTQQTTGGRS